MNCINSKSFENGCSGLIPCTQFQEFMGLITDNFLDKKPLQSELIMKYVNSDFLIKILHEIKTNCNHDCFAFNFYSIRLDVYELLIKNNIITTNTTNTTNTIDMKFILYNLFKTFVGKDKEKINRLNFYIKYFWNKIIQEDEKSLLDYREEQFQYSMIHSILDGPYSKLNEEYFYKFLELWDCYYPSCELPTTKQPNEISDGLTIYLLLSRKFMSKEIEVLLKRKSYKPHLYEWCINSGDVFNTKNIPFISYLLQENAHIMDEMTLEKFAKVLDVFIKNGKFNFDAKVNETHANLMDYLNQYGYNYFQSPVMKVFEEYVLSAPSNINVKYKKCIPQKNTPFFEIWDEYEYTKDPSFAEKILEKCMNEELRTGQSSYEFLKISGLIHVTSQLIKDEEYWF
jgi:hypothetical protein